MTKNMTMRWDEKRYYSLDYYLKQTYGEKLYKIALDGGMTCPNRDGTLGVRGCIFCSAGGSGDFAGDRRTSITEQIEAGKAQSIRKHSGSSYIAYFQAYTNTGFLFEIRLYRSDQSPRYSYPVHRHKTGLSKR